MKHIIVQFHTESITPKGTKPIDVYYDNTWKKPGYMKPDAFWELPKWIGELTYILKSAGVKPQLKVLKQSRVFTGITKKTIYCSVLDANKHLVEELIRTNPRAEFVLGGYVDIDWYKRFGSNVKYYDSMQQMKSQRFKIRSDTGLVDWSLFKSEECIPRITLSTGCKHNCSFCTIDNTVIQMSDSVICHQVYALRSLKFELVYIDDKTFGQADNYRLLKVLSHIIVGFNKKFKGFIIQTTASQVKKINFDQLSIYAAEIGVESYNDPILKKLHKPATEKTIKEVRVILREEGIHYIPNIIVGFLEETPETYTNTLNYLKEADIFHVNLYNLAIDEDAELGDSITHNTANDRDELQTFKSYNSNKKNQLDELVLQTIAKKLNEKLFNLNKYK